MIPGGEVVDEVRGEAEVLETHGDRVRPAHPGHPSGAEYRAGARSTRWGRTWRGRRGLPQPDRAGEPDGLGGWCAWVRWWWCWCGSGSPRVGARSSGVSPRCRRTTTPPSSRPRRVDRGDERGREVHRERVAVHRRHGGRGATPAQQQAAADYVAGLPASRCPARAARDPRRLPHRGAPSRHSQPGWRGTAPGRAGGRGQGDRAGRGDHRLFEAADEPRASATTSSSRPA